MDKKAIRRWIILGIVAAVFIGLLLLGNFFEDFDLGDWPLLTIIATPFLALFKGIGNLLKGSDEQQAIREEYAGLREEEAAYHDSVTTTLAASEERVSHLRTNLEAIDGTLADLQKRRDELVSDVMNMPTDELTELSKRLYKERLGRRG